MPLRGMIPRAFNSFAFMFWQRPVIYKETMLGTSAQISRTLFEQPSLMI